MIVLVELYNETNIAFATQTGDLRGTCRCSLAYQCGSSTWTNQSTSKYNKLISASWQQLPEGDFWISDSQKILFLIVCYDHFQEKHVSICMNLYVNWNLLKVLWHTYKKENLYFFSVRENIVMQFKRKLLEKNKICI